MFNFSKGPFVQSPRQRYLEKSIPPPQNQYKAVVPVSVQKTKVVYLFLDKSIPFVSDELFKYRSCINIS